MYDSADLGSYKGSYSIHQESVHILRCKYNIARASHFLQLIPLNSY